jgi:hypothetical protein
MSRLGHGVDIAVATRSEADYAESIRYFTQSTWTFDVQDEFGNWPSEYDGPIPFSATFEPSANGATATADGMCAAYQGTWPYAPGVDNFGTDEVAVSFSLTVEGSQGTSTSYTNKPALRYYRDATAVSPLIEVLSTASRGALSFIGRAVTINVYDAAGAVAATFSKTIGNGGIQPYITVVKTPTVVEVYIDAYLEATIDVSAYTFAPSVAGDVDHRVEFYSFMGAGTIQHTFNELLIVSKRLTAGEVSWLYDGGSIRSLGELE